MGRPERSGSPDRRHEPAANRTRRRNSSSWSRSLGRGVAFSPGSTLGWSNSDPGRHSARSRDPSGVVQKSYAVGTAADGGRRRSRAGRGHRRPARALGLSRYAARGGSGPPGVAVTDTHPAATAIASSNNATAANLARLRRRRTPVRNPGMCWFMAWLLSRLSTPVTFLGSITRDSTLWGATTRPATHSVAAAPESMQRPNRQGSCY